MGSSFRDPSGFIFRRNNLVLRQVNKCYAAEYDQLMSGGLYAKLSGAGLLIDHRESTEAPADSTTAYKILEPRQLSFISHPYEWSFSQLKDAALLTLQIQSEAIAQGMSLKDASAYNVQIHEGRLVFIDTLSFEPYDETRPWVAYRQFCQHFLAPLALMSLTDISLGQLLRIHLDGIPLPLASKLLPFRTRWKWGLAVHIHLHARNQLKYANTPDAMRRPTARGYSRRHLQNLLADLTVAVSNLEWRGGDTEWASYYEDNNNYTRDSMSAKESVVKEFLQSERGIVWDLGANNGRFSRLAADAGARTVVSWDIDPSCVEANYRHVKTSKNPRIMPLLLDLTNPSPAQGWAHGERSSLLERGPADTVLALGLVHHLAISNNVPLNRVAAFLAKAGRTLIIEWVPKEDSQVQRLLASRTDVFPEYTQAGFEKAFSSVFKIRCSQAIEGSARILYRMEAH